MEQITPNNTSINNSVSSSPIGQPKKPFNAKLVAIIAGVALLVGAGVFAAMYPWGASRVDDVAVSPMATQTPAQTSTPTPSTSPAADETAGWQTYRNEKYGFEVKIPNTWPKFNVRERSVDEAAVAGGAKLLEFGFLTNSTKWPTENGFAYIWGLLVLTPDQYIKYSDPRDGGKPEIFKQNENYIFSVVHGNGGAPDDLENQKSSVVFSTFKFTK